MPQQPESPKPSTSFRLSSEARDLVRALSSNLGISQASVVELAVRKMAREYSYESK